MEETMEPGSIRMRTLRMNELGYHNPYYLQNDQVNIHTGYMIRSDTIILSGHHTQLEARYDDGASVHGRKVDIQKDRRGVCFPLARFLLDPFKGIHVGMDFPNLSGW
jgi:hypothetical protein